MRIETQVLHADTLVPSLNILLSDIWAVGSTMPEQTEIVTGTAFT